MSTSAKSHKQPIGVFDSGIGGLTALRKLAELLPDEDLLYLGDTARVPYGNRSAETIEHYAKECAEFLLAHSVKQIVVACNSASAVALNLIEQISHVPVVGVIKPAVNAVLRHNYRRVGIIGTRATIHSRSYELEIQAQRHVGDVLVFPQACPLFVPLIEEGWHQHPIAFSVAQEYLAPLQAANIDALILACTHYPFLTEVIRHLLPNVQLIDSGAEAATLAAEQFIASTAGGTTMGSTRKIDCYVTDLTPTFVNLAHQFLGLPPQALHQIGLREVSNT